jgi:hypothetical protein
MRGELGGDKGMMKFPSTIGNLVDDFWGLALQLIDGSGSGQTSLSAKTQIGKDLVLTSSLH